MECFFVETQPFTHKVVKLGLEEELARAEAELRRNPRAGAVEPGTCGLRKLRMRDSARGQGKRFGARIYYVYVPREQAIYLMSIYRKDQQLALTPEQKRELCRRLRNWGAE